MSNRDGRPLVVLLDRPDRLDAVARRLRSDGATVVSGWHVAGSEWRLSELRCGSVSSVADAADALAALRRCSGAILAVDLEGPEADRFLVDLHRVAEVRTERPPAPSNPLPLSAEQRELLTLVAEGSSVPEAAKALFLSPRTAERRLGAARKALGVRSTAQAIDKLLAESGSSG